MNGLKSPNLGRFENRAETGRGKPSKLGRFAAAVGLTFHAIETRTLDGDELDAAIDLARGGSFRRSSGYLLELLTEYQAAGGA